MEYIPRLPKEPARDYALRFLKHNIINLHLAPGTMVSTTEISEATGVSRTPVREAMQELETRGILEIFPQAGSRISYINYDLIHESGAIRQLLETSVVMDVCGGMDPAWVEKFQDNLEAQAKVADRRDASGFMALDLRFHRLLYEAAGKLFTYHTLENCMWHFNRLRTLSFNAVAVGQFHRDHEAIFRAIVEKNRSRAKLLTVKHLTRYQKDEAIIRAKYPHFFADSRHPAKA